MDEITKKLREHNLKVTPQRLAIYNMIINTNKHPSAETIYNTIKTDYPTMSLATVYKTVASFKLVNLIQELNIGDESIRYDGNTEFHAHLICTECKEIFDYKIPDFLKDAKNNIEKDMNFEFLYEQIYFYGICKNCKNK